MQLVFNHFSHSDSPTKWTFNTLNWLIHILNPPELVDQAEHKHSNNASTFNLSLPLSQAALVPLWAMAPKSVQEAFSQDFLTVSLLSVVSQEFPSFSSSCFFFFFPSGAVHSQAVHPESQVQVQQIYRHFVLRHDDAHAVAASTTKTFTNNCNPLICTRLSSLVCVCYKWSLKQKKKGKTPPRILNRRSRPTGYARWLHGDLGLDKRGEAGESRAQVCLRSNPPAVGLCRSLIPPKGN